MTESAPEEPGNRMPGDPEDFLSDYPGHMVEEDPGYLVETGQAAAADGSVVPIIGGLPAAEGSAWDIGAAEEDRGPGLADDQGGRP